MQRLEEIAHDAFDDGPLPDDRLRARIVVRLQRRPARRPSTTVDPSPLCAHDVDERIAYGSQAACDALRELLGSQLADNPEESSIRPVAIVVPPSQIVDSHRRLSYVTPADSQRTLPYLRQP